MLESPEANTISDKVAKHVLKNHTNNYKFYSFLERGSDERQFCSPGLELPICNLMRSKYAEYDEYHTSLDNLDVVSPEGLGGGLEVVKKCLLVIENNIKPKSNFICEP